MANTSGFGCKYRVVSLRCYQIGDLIGWFKQKYCKLTVHRVQIEQIEFIAKILLYRHRELTTSNSIVAIKSKVSSCIAIEYNVQYLVDRCIYILPGP